MCFRIEEIEKNLSSDYMDIINYRMEQKKQHSVYQTHRSIKKIRKKTNIPVLLSLKEYNNKVSVLFSMHFLKSFF